MYTMSKIVIVLELLHFRGEIALTSLRGVTDILKCLFEELGIVLNFYLN